MSKQGDESKNTSRRKFTKSAIVALAVTPIVSTTTWADGDPQEGPKPKQDGSPITVGGGGGGEGKPRLQVFLPYVKFADANLYPDQTGGLKKKKLFQRQDLPIKSIIVWVNGVPVDVSSLIPHDNDVYIKVSCTGSSDDFEIYGQKLGIRFHTGKYPPEMGNDHHSTEINAIEGFGVYSSLGSFERKNLSPFEVVKIKVDVI
jgi:hypothetical protein